jgi:hypothetical protein
MSGEHVVERALPWLAAVAVALPVALCRYPPMLDLPCHEEIVAAMRHFGDTTRHPRGLLAWNLGHPNQLFYFLAYAVAFLVPVAIACKVVVVASVAAVPLAGARLADHLGTSRWTAVAIAPLALGFFFFFGFVGNLLGLSLLIASLPLLDRFAREPTLRRAAMVVLALFLLYEAHESALLVGCLAIVVLALGRPPAFRATVWRVALIALAAAGMVMEQARAMGHLSPQLRALPTVFDLALWQKRNGLPEALLGLHGSTTTLFPFYVVTLAVGLLAAHGVLQRGPPPPTGGPLLYLDRYRFELLGGLLVVFYFVFPFSIVGAMWLHARFLTPGVAVLTIALAPRLPTKPWLLARAAAMGAIAAVVALLRPEFGATGALYADLDPLLARIEPGSAIVAVSLTGGLRRGLVFTVGGTAARASAERGGRMAVSFTQASPIPPVVIAPEHRWDDSFARMANDSRTLEPAFDLRRFRYVISWTPLAQADDLTRALAPEARPVARSGGWLLFESTLPQEGLMSREPTSHGEESLRARLEALRSASDSTTSRPH